MTWNPSLYLKFADDRLRPGYELLGRVGTLPPGDIYDLGCGTGQHAHTLAERWPDRRIVGIDNAPAMLAKAAATPGRVVWQEGDIATWAPPAPAALVFSNAALQWLDGHARLIPRLMAQVAPGGTLAIQMPRNFAAPSHTLMRETATDGPWADKLLPLLRPAPVQPPPAYYDMLTPLAETPIDVWETEYLHVLEGERPIVEWVRGTALAPLLDALSESEAAAFVKSYGERVDRAYRRRTDGRTLFPFRRVFVVARRRAA